MKTGSRERVVVPLRPDGDELQTLRAENARAGKPARCMVTSRLSPSGRTSRVMVTDS